MKAHKARFQEKKTLVSSTTGKLGAAKQQRAEAHKTARKPVKDWDAIHAKVQT